MNEQQTEAKAKKESDGGMLDILQVFTVVITLFILAFTFLGRQSVVVGSSMNPTLLEGERLIISKLFYTPKYGDIVVIRKESALDDAFIKRVIATEGQTVDIDFEEGIVYVDGAALDEPYTLEPTYVREHFVGPTEVPEGCVFVMGDNRNNSKDSRWSTIGCVDTRYILGRVVIRLLPFDRFGRIPGV